MGIARASETLDALEERLRHSPLTDPRAWPAYGALLIDAQRMVSELLTPAKGRPSPQKTRRSADEFSGVRNRKIDV